MKTSHIVLTLAGVASAFLIWKAWNKPSASKEGSTSSNTDPLAGRPNLSDKDSTNFDGPRGFLDFYGGNYNLKTRGGSVAGRLKATGTGNPKDSGFCKNGIIIGPDANGKYTCYVNAN